MHQFDTRDGSAATVVQPPLSQAVGYVIVVVLGLVIAIGTNIYRIFLMHATDICTAMMFVTRLLGKTLGEDNKKTEMSVYNKKTPSIILD
jgi:urea-proton symporter